MNLLIYIIEVFLCEPHSFFFGMNRALSLRLRYQIQQLAYQWSRFQFQTTHQLFGADQARRQDAIAAIANAWWENGPRNC